jgi:hypothetical protein
MSADIHFYLKQMKTLCPRSIDDDDKRPRVAKGSASIILARRKHGHRVIAICQRTLMIATDNDGPLADYPTQTTELA